MKFRRSRLVTYKLPRTYEFVNEPLRGDDGGSPPCDTPRAAGRQSLLAGVAEIMTQPTRIGTIGRRGSCAPLVGMIVCVLAALLGVGCIISVPYQGTSGSVSWEVGKDSVTLRETAGLGIQFTSLKYVLPLPPAGYYRSYGEEPVRGRLEPHGVLRVPIPRAASAGDAEYEFRGMDDDGRQVNVIVRVQFREVP
jgi:hypothetical protein